MANELQIERVFNLPMAAKAIEGLNLNQATKEKAGISKSHAYKMKALLEEHSDEFSLVADEDQADIRPKLERALTALSLTLGMVPGLLIKDQSKFSAGLYLQLDTLKNIDDKPGSDDSDANDFDASAFTWALLYRGMARLNRGLEVRATSAWTSINEDILALNDDLNSEEPTEPLGILKHANKALKRINAIRGKDVDVSFFVSLQYGFITDSQMQDAHLLIGPIIHKRDVIPNGIELLRRNPVDEAKIKACKEQIGKVQDDFVKKLREFHPNDRRAASENIYIKTGFSLPHAFLDSLSIKSEDAFSIKSEGNEGGNTTMD